MRAKKIQSPRVIYLVGPFRLPKRSKNIVAAIFPSGAGANGA